MSWSNLRKDSSSRRSLASSMNDISFVIMDSRTSLLFSSIRFICNWSRVLLKSGINAFNSENGTPCSYSSLMQPKSLASSLVSLFNCSNALLLMVLPPYQKLVPIIITRCFCETSKTVSGTQKKHGISFHRICSAFFVSFHCRCITELRVTRRRFLHNHGTTDNCIMASYIRY